MAANHRAGRRTKFVLSRLLALNCPYLQGMEESVVSKIVLTPGEARIRILSWLIQWFLTDLPVNQLNTSISMDTSTLMTCLANIGICTTRDIALIEGHTSLQQQLLFFECILDMVEAAKSKESVHQLECSCRFADAICCCEKLETSVFTCSLNLLPAELGHFPESRAVNVEQLSREKDRLTVVLHERQGELQSVISQLLLKDTGPAAVAWSAYTGIYNCVPFTPANATVHHQYEEVNNAVIQGCIKTLAISVRTLTQLVVNFCQSYEAELQPWVGHRMPPALGPLGMVGKRTTTHWSHISKILSSLQQLDVTLERLNNMPIMGATTNLNACHKAQEILQQCIDL